MFFAILSIVILCLAVSAANSSLNFLLDVKKDLKELDILSKSIDKSLEENEEFLKRVEKLLHQEED